MKTKLNLLPFRRWITGFAIGCSALLADAQTSTFTYQGRLDSGTVPANGSYDLQFALFDAPSNGTQRGPLLTQAATWITNGLFAASLDFGGTVFDGADRWLQLGVRTNGGVAFTALAPRQRLTSTPYAVRAANAATAGTVAATNLSGALLVSQLPTNVALRMGGNVFSGPQQFNDGMVGIGGAPFMPLTVRGIEGDANNFLGFQSSQGANLWHITGAGGGLNFAETGVADARLFLAPGGNVGIGTPVPQSKLEVTGGIRARGGAPGPFGSFDNGYAFTGNGGDDDSGLFSLGDGQLQFFNNNVQTMWLAEGGVGINYDLFLAGNANVSGYLGVQAINVNQRLNINGPNGNSVRVQGPGGFGSTVAMDFATYDPGTNAPAARILAVDGNWTAGLNFQTKAPGAPENALVSRMSITSDGNVGIGTINPATKLHVNGEITCTAINITSDRNAKAGFAPVAAQDVLAKVVSLPITEWHYKEQPDARHIGPMAQDFHAAFAVGRSDRSITTVDADGVALAAIQGLNQKLEQIDQAKTARIQELEKTLSELEALVRRLARDK